MTGAPIAVLVQPLVEPVLGGVAFGIDPVTGRADRRIVTAVTAEWLSPGDRSLAIDQSSVGV